MSPAEPAGPGDGARHGRPSGPERRPATSFLVARPGHPTRMAALLRPPLRSMPVSTLLRRSRVGLHVALLAVAAALGSRPAAAPLQGPSRPDHVLWRNARGQTTTIVGTVTECSLTQVVVDTARSERKLDAGDVERVVYGDVPPTYAEGQTYLDRRDWPNAAAKFSLAATDGAARPVVRAAARLAAARAWLSSGASDPAAFASARSECEKFLSENPQNRDVPRVRLLLGRAQRLAGDASAAADTLGQLFAEAGAGTKGYPPSITFQAGLDAAEAHLAAGATDRARALFADLDGKINGALANLSEGDPQRAVLADLQADARLGEGFWLLASGSVSQAKTFFQGQLNGTDVSAARRFGAQLGLAEALLAEGDARGASLAFAEVSAIDYTDRDRVARALVGLVRCARKLGGPQDLKDAERWLATVKEQYGDTPAVLEAQSLDKNP